MILFSPNDPPPLRGEAAGNIMAQLTARDDHMAMVREIKNENGGS
jgi:hypothetical protein